MRLSRATLSPLVKAERGTRPVKFQTTVPLLSPLPSATPANTAGAAPLSPSHCLERHLYQNTVATSNAYQLEDFWFLFALHLFFLAIVHRNDSRVRGINSQRTRPWEAIFISNCWTYVSFWGVFSLPERDKNRHFLKKKWCFQKFKHAFSSKVYLKLLLKLLKGMRTFTTNSQKATRAFGCFSHIFVRFFCSFWNPSLVLKIPK